MTYASLGSDVRPNDYITHADGIKLLTGGISSFLSRYYSFTLRLLASHHTSILIIWRRSNLKEAIVPIVDEHDVKHTGSRLIGFVMIQLVKPRKLASRRGEIAFDLNEGI